MPPPQAPPPFFGQNSRQPTPILPITPKRMNMSVTDHPVNILETPHFLRNMASPETVFPPENLMSSTILDRNEEASSVQGLGSDLMGNLRERAKDVLEKIGRKSSELLTFDNILNKKGSDDGRSEGEKDDDDFVGNLDECVPDPFAFVFSIRFANPDL